MSPKPPQDDALATEIRRRRRARGWSLRALAAESGVSPAMLSDIERGTKSPTLRLAYQIARALGCSVTDLVGGDDRSGGPGVLAGRSRVLSDDAAGVRRVGYSTPIQHGRLEIVTYELAPGAATDVLDPNRPGTIETVAVLEGALDLEFDGSVTRVEHETCAGHGTGAVVYRNASASEPCRFLAIVDSTRC